MHMHSPSLQTSLLSLNEESAGNGKVAYYFLWQCTWKMLLFRVLLGTYCNLMLSIVSFIIGLMFGVAIAFGHLIFGT